MKDHLHIALAAAMVWFVWNGLTALSQFVVFYYLANLVH